MTPRPYFPPRHGHRFTHRHPADSRIACELRCGCLCDEVYDQDGRLAGSALAEQEDDFRFTEAAAFRVLDGTYGSDLPVEDYIGAYMVVSKIDAARAALGIQVAS